MTPQVLRKTKATGCAECGADCPPEPTVVEGIRIAFVRPEHGVHSFIDPFEE